MLNLHHLTYERIFKEELDDLMVLCRKHHELVEKLIRAHYLRKARTNAEKKAVLFSLLGKYRPTPAKPKAQPKRKVLKPLSDADFNGPLRQFLNRNGFKYEIRRLWRSREDFSSVMQRALVLFERRRATFFVSQTQAPSAQSKPNPNDKHSRSVL